MIRRILVLAVLLFAGYNAALLVPRVREQFWMDQGQHQQNIIKAQEFLLERHRYNVIVVGSSMAARLPEASLGPGARNLGFAGGSVFTGLKLIAAHPTRPKLVLIETNTVMRGEDRDILANAQMPVVSEMRPYLPGLREKYEPSNVLGGRIYEVLARSRAALGLDEAASGAPRAAADAAGSAGVGDAARAVLDGARRVQSVPPDQDELQRRLDELRILVTTLGQHGVQCVFMELPVDRSLSSSVYARTIRSAIRSRFLVEDVPWIEPPPATHYQLRDGLHLSRTDADDFARYIRTSIGQLWPHSG